MQIIILVLTGWQEIKSIIRLIDYGEILMYHKYCFGNSSQ